MRTRRRLHLPTGRRTLGSSHHLGYTADGKRKRKRKAIYARTKREVQEKLAELQHQKATGTLTDASKMTISEWLTHWLETIARPKLRSTTAEGYRSIKDYHLIPRVGGIKLAKFTAVNLQAMYADMQRDGHSGQTCQRVHAVIRQALNVVMRQRLIQQNPCQLVDVPKYDKPEMKTLSAEHAAKLLAVSEGDRFHALIVRALTTGMRQGEIFGLKWEDIDLEAGRLSVRRTLLETKGKLSFGPPKSKSGMRSIKLSDAAVTAPWSHKAPDGQGRVRRRRDGLL